MRSEKHMYDKIFELGKKRGIVYPSFEVYGGLSGFIDWGPIGVRIKRNVEKLLRKTYVHELECLEVECPNLHPEEVFEASGHIKSFADYMTECTMCGEPYRADHLIGDERGIEVEGKSKTEINNYLSEIKCPKCSGDLGEAYSYNLMFETSVGPGKSKKTTYLRPETAQSTYIGFNRLWQVARRTLPFGVLQVGRSYRNEISPRQGMIRLREFNQAEIQFFYDPNNMFVEGFEEVSDIKVEILDKNEQTHKLSLGEAYREKVIGNQVLAYHLGVAYRFFQSIGLPGERLVLRQHREDERSFYSSDTWDIEYISGELGKIEMVGIALRSDYDLTQHAKYSGKNFSVTTENGKFTPHVVEVAYGVDRPIYCLLESCLDDRGFALKREVSPYDVCVFPLVKKDGVDVKAREIYGKLKKEGLSVFYDKAGSIGKRYARSDEIGISYCVTVDYDTLEDDTVTLRVRSDKSQVRKKTSEVIGIL
ncbi:MAG: glycine--tRNA ligase [Candidatus Altiarchaeales archaeon]|nr:glycine--tRNA ligase [Candidatus Altiarchaeales archaeon]